MRIYLTCPRRKGNPKVAIEVCRACRRNKSCRQYYTYRNPPLFPELGKPQGNAIP
ncbi:MAG TPA: hypothetical protein PLT09_00795 [Deltaproteobacteria bacterium]|nr:hypothetical protein [Deltaproteobacteria bacterium]HPR53854.1 hypothetical protein [Deltaproteobacteria bacterium]HXK45946.1 hypothetical protein [Deltaproteobacteria bacterium]